MADPVEIFLSTYPEDMQKICRELRSLIKHTMRDAYEFLYYDAINYSLSYSPIDRVCYVKPLQKHATLGFLFGHRLHDPNHQLRGTGARTRHIRLRSVDQTRDKNLKELVKRAWEDARVAIAERKQELKQRVRSRTKTPTKHSTTPARKRPCRHAGRTRRKPLPNHRLAAAEKSASKKTAEKHHRIKQKQRKTVTSLRADYLKRGEGCARQNPFLNVFEPRTHTQAETGPLGKGVINARTKN